jgi:hypothetical protein
MTVGPDLRGARKGMNAVAVGKSRLATRYVGTIFVSGSRCSHNVATGQRALDIVLTM